MRLQLSIRQGRRQHAAQHAAFEDLHREHAVGIYNLAVRLVGDREDARDISQDVLLKAFERLGKPGELNQRAWLYRVTVNACYDHLRTLRRRPRRADGAPEAASGVDGFEQAELVSAVEAALRRLPRHSEPHCCCVRSTACRPARSPSCWGPSRIPPR